MESYKVCPGFNWKVQQHSFKFNLGVFEMGSYDPVLFDFEKLCDETQQLLHRGGRDFMSPLIYIQVLCCAEPTLHVLTTSNYLEELLTLLEKYESIFTEPIAPPPFRSHNHSIALVPTAAPVNIRSYGYPHFQKVEIEKLVDEIVRIRSFNQIPAHMPLQYF